MVHIQGSNSYVYNVDVVGKFQLFIRKGFTAVTKEIFSNDPGLEIHVIHTHDDNLNIKILMS